MAHHGDSGKRILKGAGGVVWIEVRKGVFVPENSLTAYESAKERRDTSRAYLEKLKITGVELPKGGPGFG